MASLSATNREVWIATVQRKVFSMAVFLIRVRYSETSRKTMAQNPKTPLERKATMQRLCDDLGCKLLGVYLSLVTGEGVTCVEGPTETATIIQQVMLSTGAYDTIEKDVLVTVEELTDNRSRVEKLAASFRPPDRDEIDNLLLDE